MYDIWFEAHLSTLMTLYVAVPNCIITVGVLMILIILEAKNHFTELCLNGAAGILNIVIGILLLVNMRDHNRAAYLLLSITTIACGVVMIIDCIREFKAK